MCHTNGIPFTWKLATRGKKIPHDIVTYISHYGFSHGKDSIRLDLCDLLEKMPR